MDRPNRVALCVTCLVDQFMPEVGRATVNVLRGTGYEVEFPQAQSCCGQPFFNSGFRQQATRLAIRTITIFEPYPAVILPSGSCTAMIRVEYPHLLSGRPEWADRAQDLANKTFELSEFLVHGGKLPNHGAGDKAGQPVTYHDSCHMCRLLGLRDEPRAALSAAGYSLHEMKEPDRCCGFGGLFSLRMPEVSTAMTARKLGQVSDVGAPVITADPGCLLQMRGLAQETGVSVEHLATALERQLDHPSKPHDL